jgi:hypothetical protein
MHTETLRTLTGKLKVTIPENLNELTVGQLIEIQSLENASDLKPLAILSGVPEDDLANISQLELDKFTNRILSLSHQITYCYQGDKVPEYVSFGFKYVKRFGIRFKKENRVKVSTNLSVEPAGAFLASRDIIADEINKHIEAFGEDNWKANFQPSLDAIATVLAHYFYCRATGLPYVEQKAEEFKSEVLKLSVQEALPVGRHFFLQFPNLLQQKMSFWVAFRLRLKRERVLRNLRNSGSTTR